MSKTTLTVEIWGQTEEDGNLECIKRKEFDQDTEWGKSTRFIKKWKKRRDIGGNPYAIDRYAGPSPELMAFCETYDTKEKLKGNNVLKRFTTVL